MYVVRILGSNGQWRTTTEPTLSAVVALTLGLETAFQIPCEAEDRIVYLNVAKYKHAERGLISRWTKHMVAHLRPALAQLYRLPDSQLWAEVAHSYE